MKGVEENFGKKPYGWYLAAIQCLVAMLSGRGRSKRAWIQTVLEGAELERALRNTQSFSNIILDPQADVTPAEMRRVKDFYGNFFDKPAKFK